ncbi:MAG: RhuM family protein [Smithella sp.]
MTPEKFMTIQETIGQVILYKNHLEVRLEKDTVWLTQKQMSELFDTDRTVISKHLRNIFSSGELEEKSNVQKMHIVNSDKPVTFYTLDAIISVGYRVNSKRGTQFRI